VHLLVSEQHIDAINAFVCRKQKPCGVVFDAK